jgi:hypothetical protein
MLQEVAGQQGEAEETEEKRPDPETYIGEAFVFRRDGGASQEEQRKSYEAAGDEQGQPDRMRHLLCFPGRVARIL